MARFDAWALGYPDELCLRPGETVGFHVSGAGAETVDAQLVKLIHGDTQPGGPGFREVEVPSTVDGTYPLRDQPTHHGSYARIPDAGSILGAVTETGVSLCAMVQPRADTGVQPLLSAWDAAAETGMALVLEPGLRPACWITGARVRLREPLLAGVWYLVCGSWDPARGMLAIRAVPVVNSYSSRFGPVTQVSAATEEVSATSAPDVPDVDLLLGAFDRSDGQIVHGAYNGKLALPCVYAGALGNGQITALAGSGAQPGVADRLRAWWDLTRHIDTSVISAAIRGTPDGRLVNQPTRAVTAHNWDGSCYEWRHAPDLYGAVHFHDDDIDDVGWEATCALRVPDDLPSGVYALRLRAAGFEDHTPFFVRAARGRESAVALVLPTASYMAYANEHLATAAPMGQAIVGHTPAVQPLDLLLMEHPELGLSMYELHADGSGVAFSSRRRPIVNMRPRHRFSFLGTW
jgi:N,N-dimethylformamidase